MPPQTWILHIDMDAFFASVEVLDNPELKGKPVAVGGTGPRSVISAASYEIRKYGVRSAMPGTTAKRLCPHGIFLPGRMSRYKEISRRVMAILRDFSPVVEQASVDEAYLDGTGLARLFGPIEDLGRAIKRRVREEVGLTCSVGAAPVRFLAKIASDRDKPDGLFILHPHQVEAFLRELDVAEIPGVGKQTLAHLHSLGVRKASDFLRYPESFWAERLGAAGPSLHAKARGIDPTGVVPEQPAKSVSAENTLADDTLDRTELDRWLLRQSERVGADLRRKGVKGRTITLKVKYADFRLVTRSRTLDEPVDDTRTILATARALLDELEPRTPIRLIGVGASNFGPVARQLSLLDQAPATPSSRALDQAMDEVRRRFGPGAVQRGDLLASKKPGKG